MLEAPGRDPVAVLACSGPAQGALHRRVAGRGLAKILSALPVSSSDVRFEKGSRSAIATLVEWTVRFIILVHLAGTAALKICATVR